MSRFADAALEELARATGEALQLAGHQIIDPPVEYRLPVAPGTISRRSIKGDVQSEDSDHQRCAFYVRPEHVSPVIPEWFSRLVRESHNIPDRPVIYLVVETDVEAHVIRDAEACGAGMLRLNADRTLTALLAPGEPTEELTDQEFDVAVDSLRSRVVSCGLLNEDRISQRFAQVVNAGPATQALRDQLVAEHAHWQEWRVGRTGELDQLKRSKSRRRLLVLTQEIEPEIQG